MTGETKRVFVVAVLTAACTAVVQAADNPALRPYPDPLPEDVSFDTVVKSQPFPFMKYPVPIIGAKVHPEEVHVTPSGELIFPYSETFKGLCLAPLVGRRLGEGGSRQIVLTMLPADNAHPRLVDGFLPAIENEWTVEALQVRQLAFAMAGNGFESLNGREPLIALVRYTIAAGPSAPGKAMLALQFGEAFGGLSVKAEPPVYPHELSFDPPFIKAKDGAYVACLLTKDLKASFKPLTPGPQADPANCVLINEKEATVKGHEYTVEVERQGDALTVGSWRTGRRGFLRGILEDPQLAYRR